MEFAFRLLLQPLSDVVRLSETLDNLDWEWFLEFAQRNVILVRSNNCFREIDFEVPCEKYKIAVELEEERVGFALGLIDSIGKICSRAGVEYVFTKAFQHYPDMGHDIDLFVPSRSSRVDKIIGESLNSTHANGSLCSWIAGKSSYTIDGCSFPLEIHHGRLGHIGEHNIYPNMVMQNRRKVVIAGTSTWIPSPEDQLIVQALQRIYGHLYIRVSDVIRSFETLSTQELNWDYAFRITKQVGIFDGFSCYLNYIDEIHNSLFDRTLLPSEAEKALRLGRWGKVRFTGWYYKFPTVSVISRVYLTKLFTEVRSLNWESIARLCVLVPVAIWVAVRAVGLGIAKWSYAMRVPDTAE